MKNLIVLLALLVIIAFPAHAEIIQNSPVNLVTGAVTSFSAGTTGLTPSSPTTGAVVLGGTLAVANGGTGDTTGNPTAFSTLTVTGTNGNSLTLNPAYVPNNTNIQIYGALHLLSDTTSLTYAMTATPAAVTSQTPLVITEPGTYTLTGIVTTNLSGVTYAAVQNAVCYLDRTNNTPGAITDTTGTQLLPILTTTTLVGPTIQLGPVSYTTSNTTDSVSVYCSVSATPSAGNFQVTGLHLSAVRIGQ